MAASATKRENATSSQPRRTTNKSQTAGDVSVRDGRDAGSAPAAVASTPIEVIDLLVGSPEAIAELSIV